METQFSRTQLLIGTQGLETLKNSSVIIFGVGGVGGYAAEALARTGVGRIALVDNDVICLSNLNRQIIATQETVGRLKTDVMRERILSVNPLAEVTVYPCFFLPESADSFDFGAYDYVVDAVDTVTAKIEIIVRSQAAGTPVISSMGAGNKMEASMLEVEDIYRTSVCPLAKVMRKELKKRGIKKQKVVYSKEEPLCPIQGEKETQPAESGRRRAVPGSMAFVPAAAGLIIAGEVVKDLTGYTG